MKGAGEETLARAGLTVDKVHTKGHGVLPVAILSGPTFAAPVIIDPETVRLAGASVRLAGKSGKLQCQARDVNQDTLPDLECHVNVDELQLQLGSTLAAFTLQPESAPVVDELSPRSLHGQPGGDREELSRWPRRLDPGCRHTPGFPADPGALG